MCPWFKLEDTFQFDITLSIVMDMNHLDWKRSYLGQVASHSQLASLFCGCQTQSVLVVLLTLDSYWFCIIWILQLLYPSSRNNYWHRDLTCWYGLLYRWRWNADGDYDHHLFKLMNLCAVHWSVWFYSPHVLTCWPYLMWKPFPFLQGISLIFLLHPVRSRGVSTVTSICLVSSLICYVHVFIGRRRCVTLGSANFMTLGVHLGTCPNHR